MVSALLIHGVPIECINQAAIAYHVPASLIISVLTVEGGDVGTASPNNNGTFDYGPMQINSIWLDKIRPYGYTREQLKNDPCINVLVGAWILSTNIADSDNLWHGVGGYHSYTPHLNHSYQNKVWHAYALLSNYLEKPPTNTAHTTLVPTASSVSDPPALSNVASTTPSPPK